jgi:hypothetical protein
MKHAKKWTGTLTEMMGDKPSRVNITIRLPIDLHERVRGILKRNKWTISKLAEVSWLRYLEENKGK